jgi:NTP pyrophosphatase (non-canonical NTP hydrolase)
MSFKTMQEEVDEWMSQYKTKYWKPLEILARLTEEVGELARELNHSYGPKKKKETEKKKEICDEISDIIFVIICLANSLNINLDEAFKKMMNKIRTRDNDRWEKV